jgi:hypothetical protein
MFRHLQEFTGFHITYRMIKRTNYKSFDNQLDLLISSYHTNVAYNF